MLDGGAVEFSCCPRFSIESGFKPVLSAARPNSRRLTVARNPIPENSATTSLAPQLTVRPGSLGANPVQEEVNGSLSTPLLGFWIRCDAVKYKAFGVPEHKI